MAGIRWRVGRSVKMTKSLYKAALAVVPRLKEDAGSCQAVAFTHQGTKYMAALCYGTSVLSTSEHFGSSLRRYGVTFFDTPSNK